MPPPTLSALRRGWSVFTLNLHSDICSDCGHPEWQHLGIRGSGCTHLGMCACSEFRSASEEAC